MILQVLLAANKICNLEEANIDLLKKPASAMDKHRFGMLARTSKWSYKWLICQRDTRSRLSFDSRKRLLYHVFANEVQEMRKNSG